MSAELVKTLRDMTSAGFMNCKKALEECDNDLEKAVEWLRKKGLSAAAKKSGRVTAEGVVSVKVADNYGIMLEVNSETDFVSKNDKFRDFVTKATDIAFSGKIASVDELKSQKYDSQKTIQDETVNLIATIGENIGIRRISTLEAPTLVANYIHSSEFPGMGKIGVLVGVDTNCADKAIVFDFAKKIAMHIAATTQMALEVKDLDQNAVQKEREIITEQARPKAKNEEILQKMIEGRVSKFFEEVVVMEQVFVIDGKTKIKDLVKNFEKENNCSLKITGYAKYTLGEGIEKQESNFAEEVMSQIK